jgi:hypothetical protein
MYGDHGATTIGVLQKVMAAFYADDIESKTA